MAHGTATRCPYVGLVPFSAEDAPFFFGREAECEIISANLMASRLTLLYGISGVGKSSVLRAGVIPFVRRVADQNRSDPEEPQFAIVEFSSWQDEPTEALIRRVHETLGDESQGRDGELPPPSGSLIEVLEFWTDRIDGDLLIVLDQFEDYFLYHPRNGCEDRFEREFSRAVNRSNLRANFLISIREDALAKLDRFKVHIPGLFDNYLRIEHLDREAGRAAIEGPIDKFNQQGGLERPVEIEPKLVEAVLDQVQAGRTHIGKGGRGGIQEGSVATDATQGIETPFLQLVMSRLWARERRTGSHVVRYQTLRDLGGASHIVRSHLEESMKSLSEDDQEVLASVFDRLVTPSGTKIALSASDLAKYTNRPAEELTPVLDKLWGSEARILRSVEPSPAEPDVPRYEIFHDVLAPAVLEWRERYVHLKQVDRWRLAVVVAVMAAILMAVVTSYVWKLKQRAQDSEQRARQSEKAARQAVDDYFTTVSQDILLNQPGLQSLRRRLLEKAREYYVPFLRKSGDDRSLQSEVARVNFYLGRIAAEIGTREEAFIHYEDARKSQERLLARKPIDKTLLDELGDTLNAIGNLWDAAYDFGQAIDAFDRAIVVRKELSERAADRGEFRRKLANSLMNRGNAKLATGLSGGDDLRQAERFHMEALHGRHRQGVEGTGPSSRRESAGDSRPGQNILQPGGFRKDERPRGRAQAFPGREESVREIPNCLSG